MLSIIVAAAANGVIGINNQLPWRLPEDLKYFKAVTLGKPIVMGRKTFDSIGRPLPGRRNVVITRQQDWQHEGVDVANSLEAAMTLLADHPEVMVIGGEQIYQQALPLADRIYLTEVSAEVEGDAWFEMPEIGWHLISVKKGEDEAAPYPYHFVVYERSLSK